MKRESVSVGSLPNYYLLTEIVQEAHELFVGAMITPQRLETITRFANDRAKVLIYEGKWLTKSVLKGRTVEFKRIEVLQSDSDPNALRIIPVWEYEEE